MKLTREQAYELLSNYCCYVMEICDKCGQLLGPVRFTRHGESGVWCSRECRDGADAHRPGTCKACKAKLPEGKRRGAMYCDGSCREAAYRSRIALRTSRTQTLSVTRTSIHVAFSPEKSRDSVAGHPKAFSSAQDEIKGEASTSFVE